MTMEAKIRIGADATQAITALDQVEKKVSGMFKSERAIERQSHKLFDALATSSNWEQVAEKGLVSMTRVFNIGLGPVLAVLAGAAIIKGVIDAQKEVEKLGKELEKASKIDFGKAAKSIESASAASDKLLNDQEKYISDIEKVNSTWTGIIAAEFGGLQKEREEVQKMYDLRVKMKQVSIQAYENDIKAGYDKINLSKEEIEEKKIHDKYLDDVAEVRKNKLLQNDLQEQDRQISGITELFRATRDKEKRENEISKHEKENKKSEEMYKGIWDMPKAENHKEDIKIWNEEFLRLNRLGLQNLKEDNKKYTEDFLKMNKEGIENLKHDKEEDKKFEEFETHKSIGGVSSLASVGGGGYKAASLQQEANNYLKRIADYFTKDSNGLITAVYE